VDKYKKILLALIILKAIGACAQSLRPGPGLGKPATSAEIEVWSIGVFPDGTGLPSGLGNALQGEKVYNQRCKSCHGPEGIGASAEELAGGNNGLVHEYPDKTIGTYWPFSTTVFDFTRRAMPLNAPGSLSNNDVYAITAYLLYINGIIGPTTEMNAKTLPKVQMPNWDGFIPVFKNK